jgi:hypothetical protein
MRRECTFRMEPAPKKKMRSFRGCQGCKQAKRRCTEERPTCQACAKAGRECQVLYLAPCSFLSRGDDGLTKQYDTDALFRFFDKDSKPETSKTEAGEKGSEDDTVIETVDNPRSMSLHLRARNTKLW